MLAVYSFEIPKARARASFLVFLSSVCGGGVRSVTLLVLDSSLPEIAVSFWFRATELQELVMASNPVAVKGRWFFN